MMNMKMIVTLQHGANATSASVRQLGIDRNFLASSNSNQRLNSNQLQTPSELKSDDKSVLNCDENDELNNCKNVNNQNQLQLQLQPQHHPYPSQFQIHSTLNEISNSLHNLTVITSSENGVWPEGRALPYPQWNNNVNLSPGNLQFGDVVQYEDFAGLVELISQQTVASHKYNTVDNFTRFYRAYKKSKMSTLYEFYREYTPPITSCHYTCVGLAYELISRLSKFFRQYNHTAANKFYVISCEEAIDTVDSYIDNQIPEKETSEKEHVMVCLRIEIGQRKGFLILDPGYHVSRTVTVMEDKMYPHTGNFTQSDDGKSTKEYEYVLLKNDYVGWNVKDTNKITGTQKVHTSLIYAGKEFLSAVQVAERRNLVYGFKSLLKRDQKGRLLAGFYFPVGNSNSKRSSSATSTTNLTFFYLENNNRVDVRIRISTNTRETNEIKQCESQLGLANGHLIRKFNRIGHILRDEAFKNELYAINKEIVEISSEN